MAHGSCVSQPMHSVMEPAEGPTGMRCIWERRKELLRRGVPKSDTLDNLREKILEQRRVRLRTLANQRRTPVEEGILVNNKVQHGVQMTRKVCRVTFSLKGGGSGGGMAVRSSSRGASERESCAKRGPARGPARSDAPSPPPLRKAPRGEHSANISAWRDAQKLMKHFLGSTRTALTSTKENVAPSPQRANSLTAPVGPQGLINKPGSTDESEALDCDQRCLDHLVLQPTSAKTGMKGIRKEFPWLCCSTEGGCFLEPCQNIPAAHRRVRSLRVTCHLTF
ncbi:hypothetical protein AALO_G00073900 [Alosa alosa]|uniref:Uncharacterized protein n=1 Tax=Alosa alosa TaxID=278164 RepID=A0AAV6H2M5_9TELE|nr:hypothetical protein AALO_G00073900 [Alosa alosa]